MKIKKMLLYFSLIVTVFSINSMLYAVTRVKTPQQARLMAKRAAISDAERNLAETIWGVRINSKTTVRNFITEDDIIKTKVRAVLRGAIVVDTKYDRDGVCTVRMEVPVSMLQRALGRRFAWPGDVIRATGSGAPNPVARVTPPDPPPPPEDSWHTLVIKATGSGVAPSEMAETSQGRLMAERAAYADALRQLGENIKGVKVSSRTTVRNFITENDEIRTRFEAFLRGARRTETRHLDDGSGICEVDVEIPLEGMRSLIRKKERNRNKYGDKQKKYKDKKYKDQKKYY
jgi:hypothetical protein